jgi:hypothetical protein
MECHTAGSFFLDVLKTFAAFLALVTAFVAYRVYRFNSRLERAKWLNTLYERFYEKDELKKVRDILDCDSGESPAVDELVRSESKEFTDYLNFFEFVAVLSKSKQLAEGGVEDLFGYYLDCLAKSRQVRAYIADKAKGYEHLDRLLRERSAMK